MTPETIVRILRVPDGDLHRDWHFLLPGGGGGQTVWSPVGVGAKPFDPRWGWGSNRLIPGGDGGQAA